MYKCYSTLLFAIKFFFLLAWKVVIDLNNNGSCVSLMNLNIISSNFRDYVFFYIIFSEYKS